MKVRVPPAATAAERRARLLGALLYLAVTAPLVAAALLKAP